MLTIKQKALDNKIRAALPKHLRSVYEERMEAVKGYIDFFSAHPFNGTDVGAVLNDATSSRGKMIRPRLVLLAGEFGPDWDSARDRLCKLAAIVELTHIASLIHDDIVDDAPYRRGLPSIQQKYGKNAAVYAGDFLMSRISYYIMEGDMNRAGIIISKTVEEMCVGEIGQSTCRYKEDVTLEDYLRNIHGKTVALIMTCCHIGAMEAGCDEKTIRNLELFGECFGYLFQLRDDLLDFTSDVLTIGKAAHQDFKDGIYTMPVLYALKQPGGREALLPYMRANAEGKLTAEQLFHMEKIVKKLGGVEATRQEIRNRLNQAEVLLDKLPDCEASSLLVKFIHKLGKV